MTEIDSFIGVFDNCVSSSYCDSLIDYFYWCKNNNKVWQRGEATGLYKSDLSTCLNPIAYNEISFSYNSLQNYLEEFNNSFWNDCYKQYTAKYDVINGFDKHTIHTYKIQETFPGQGYHVWHCENGSAGDTRRIGTYILYLNDVNEGGETEFLYLSKRISPKKGRLLIFPAGYTHTHRGNPPLSGVKYIMTGWIEYS